MKNMTPAQFIADLYELKSKLVNPVDYRQTYAEPNITYAVIQTLIATFSDKYKVDWQAVGKVRGWGDEDEWSNTKCDCGGKIHPLMDLHDPQCSKVKAKRGWKFHWKKLIDHLADGKTIEEALTSIE